MQLVSVCKLPQGCPKCRILEERTNTAGFEKGNGGNMTVSPKWKPSIKRGERSSKCNFI